MSWPIPKKEDRLPVRFTQTRTFMYAPSPDEFVFDRQYLVSWPDGLLLPLLPAGIRRLPNEIGVHITAVQQLAIDIGWTWSPTERQGL